MKSLTVCLQAVEPKALNCSHHCKETSGKVTRSFDRAELRAKRACRIVAAYRLYKSMLESYMYIA